MAGAVLTVSAEDVREPLSHLVQQSLIVSWQFKMLDEPFHGEWLSCLPHLAGQSAGGYNFPVQIMSIFLILHQHFLHHLARAGPVKEMDSI